MRCGCRDVADRVLIAGRPADRRAQSPLLVGSAGGTRAGRVVSGAFPLRTHGRGALEPLSDLRTSGSVRHRNGDIARGKGVPTHQLRHSCSTRRPRSGSRLKAGLPMFANGRRAFNPGVAHLARRCSGRSFLPLALEYLFWEERYPEALARFGQAIIVERGADRSVEEWRTCIEGALASTQDALAAEARSAAIPLPSKHWSGARLGVGGVYDWWRWLRARLSWHPFPSRARRQGSASCTRRSVMIAIGLAVVVLVLAAIPALRFAPTCVVYRPPPPASSQGKDGTVPALSVLIPAQRGKRDRRRCGGGPRQPGRGV